MLLKTGIQDVTNGHYSKTAFAAAGTTALNTFNDGVNDILFGRRPLGDYDKLVKNWQNAARDQMRGAIIPSP